MPTSLSLLLFLKLQNTRNACTTLASPIRQQKVINYIHQLHSYSLNRDHIISILNISIIIIIGTQSVVQRQFNILTDWLIKASTPFSHINNTPW